MKQRRSKLWSDEQAAAALPTAFFHAMQRWYQDHGRRLPWTGERDPYRVWLREIMLQQTTVVAVIPYLERFLNRFPDVTSLAQASLDDVLALWSGLGYYRRARHLHQTAVLIQQHYAGHFPDDLAVLQKLPGVGRYTAAAIAAFAFDRPVGLVETNTRRVYCRLAGYAGDPQSPAGQRWLWEWSEQLAQQAVSPDLHKRHFSGTAGDWHQALMDLGAEICTPIQTRCQICPVEAWCMARHQGRVGELPKLAPRPAMTARRELALVFLRRSHRQRPPQHEVWLHQYAAGQRWAGLWDVPRFSLADQDDPAEVARNKLQLLTDCPQLRLQPLPAQRYSITRYRVSVVVFRVLCLSKKSLEMNPSIDSHLSTQQGWFPLSTCPQLALTSPARSLLQRLRDEPLSLS
ncbi:MAG: A/G-specific adenine glycosylase [Planctomycetaceae bacterium]|nr:MAG: A/G-specific adenine glycosylase [Planctomycetaceae bacterium]